MHKSVEFDPSRRSVLKGGVAIAAVGAVAATGLLKPRLARAQSAKMSQATAMYQAKPHGQQFCENCIHFVPGKTKAAMGTCKVVDGTISPQGWCVAYAPKS